MFCPACKGEFREGFTVCNTCHVGLVEDLDNLPEKIEGEFMACIECEKKYDGNTEVCPECGLKLVRAIEGENGFVMLEEPNYEAVPQVEKCDLSQYEHCIDLSEEPTEVLLESEDLEIIQQIMSMLDKNGFYFDFYTPYNRTNTLGSVFGENTPLAHNFPQIIVREADIQAATDLIANSSELGLFDVPDELNELAECEEEPEDENL